MLVHFTAGETEQSLVMKLPFSADLTFSKTKKKKRKRERKRQHRQNKYSLYSLYAFKGKLKTTLYICFSVSKHADNKYINTNILSLYII